MYSFFSKKMANVCRLCGNNEDNVVFIYGNEALTHHIDLKIRVGLDIQIFPDDPLPKHACVCCLGKLDEFWTFQHHCRRVQTELRRLLPEQVTFQFQNINHDQHLNSKTSTEECSAHIEVLETLRDSTDNDANNPGDLNSNINDKVEVDKVKLETHSNENSNDSFNSGNDSHGNKCESFVNDPYLIDRYLLGSTRNDTTLADGQLDSCCEVKEDNFAIRAAGYTSESAPEYNPDSVEGESEVQDNLSFEKTDLTSTVLERSGTLSVNNNNVNTQSFSDGPQDPLLMEEQTFQLPNTALSTTSIITVGEKGPEDKRSNDTFSFLNDLNQNLLQAPNMIPENSHYLTTANNGCYGNQSTNSCGFLSNNSQSSFLMEEQSSKNRNYGTDGTQVISRVVVNNVINNEKEVDCDSVFNTLGYPLSKEENTTTIPTTDTCSHSLSVHDLHGEAASRDCFDFSQVSVNIIDLPGKCPNHVGCGMTSVSSRIEASHNESTVVGNPRYLLRTVCNTIPQVTGTRTRNTEFDLNQFCRSGDSRSLQVMHSDADIADKSDQNIGTSKTVNDLRDSVAVTTENEVHQTLQINTALRSDSMIIDSGNSATCVHGINASMCIYKQCCHSHPFDKYWNSVESRFHCSLCEFATVKLHSIRRHVTVHVSMYLFECSVCSKKFHTYGNLTLHMKYHGRKDARKS